MIVYALLFMVMLAASLAYAGHDYWPITKEHQIEEGTTKACIYHRVERCADLSAPFPNLARTEGEMCSQDSTRNCLGLGAQASGGYDPVHQTIILAPGNDSDGDEALRHEMIHHLRCYDGSDCASHDGPEWVCQ